jgi:hypothetical protein
MINIYASVIFLPFLTHAILAVYIAIKIAKSIILTRKEKQLNTVLIIIIPFIWSVMMYYVLKKEPNYFDKRKRITNDSLDNDILYISNPDTGTGDQ